MVEEDGVPRADAVRRRGNILRNILLVVGVLAALAAILPGGSVLGHVARQAAARHTEAFALADALAWLDRADRVDPGNPATQLMRARCFRHMGEPEWRDDALALARKQGASREALTNEVMLGKVQAGDFTERTARTVAALRDAGYSPHDAAAALIHGYLARNDLTRAEAVWRTWVEVGCLAIRS